MQPHTPPQTPLSAHHRQIIWQVWTPLILAVIGIIVMAVLAVVASSGDFSNSLHWANISLIIMLLPGMMLVVVLIVITSLLIFLITKLLGIIPIQALRLQTWFYQAAIFVHSWANKIIEPMLQLHSTSAAGKTILRKTGLNSKSTPPDQSHQPTTPMIGRSL
jgi:cell division protein FtsW (lipid II flippase)